MQPFKTPYTLEHKTPRSRHDVVFSWVLIAILILLGISISVSIVKSVVELYLIGLV